MEDHIRYESQLIAFESRNGLTPQCLYNIFATDSSDSSYILRHTSTDSKLPKKILSKGEERLFLQGDVHQKHKFLQVYCVLLSIFIAYHSSLTLSTSCSKFPSKVAPFKKVANLNFNHAYLH